MGKTFNDDDLMVWEAFPSGAGVEGSQDSQIVFNCLTNRTRSPRRIGCEGVNEADAERIVLEASDDELRAMLKRSAALD